MVQHVEVEIEGERWVGDLAREEDTYEMKTVGKGKNRDWEEGGGYDRMGDWRRRRWVRTVRRKVLDEKITAAS